MLAATCKADRRLWGPEPDSAMGTVIASPAIAAENETADNMNQR